MEFEFTKGEFSFILKKYDNESYDIFYKRCDFILRNKNSKLKFDELIYYQKYLQMINLKNVNILMI